MRARDVVSLVLIFLAWPYPATALRDADNVIEAPDDAIPPVISMSFEESPRINTVVFSKDGESIYVLLNPRAINIWTVLVYFWPEILGAFAGISTLILALRLRRIVSRKRMIGKPYCRGCNYCLEGLPNDRCPECGDEKATSRSVIGRLMWKRVLPLSILLVLVIGGYGSLWLAEAPRYGWISYRIDWSSVELLKWATDRGITVPKGENLTNRIVEVDVKTGERIRVVLTERYTQLGFVVSPDGRTLVVDSSYEQSLRMIDIESGRVLNTIDHPWKSDVVSRSQWEQICGFSEDGRTLYAVWLDWEERETKLIAWNWKSGSYEELLDLPAEVHDPQSRTPTTNRKREMMVKPQRFFLVPNHSPPRVIQFPYGYMVEHNVVDLLVRDLDDPTNIVKTITTTIWLRGEPSFSEDGNRMYFHTWPVKHLAIEQQYMTAEEQRESITLLNRDVNGVHLALDAKRDLLFVPSRQQTGIKRTWITVYDLKRGESVGELRYPPHLLMETIDISPGGRSLAAVGFDPGSGTRDRERVHELLLYDLSPFDEPTEPIGNVSNPNSPG